MVRVFSCFIYLLILSAPSILVAQEFTPIVNQFTKRDYSASNQNWSVGQSKDRTMYFGNNLGLLKFDGASWSTYKMPKSKMVRSLMIDKQDRIFVGSFEEFGYFERNSLGELIYTSISDKLVDFPMKNDEIWNILDFNGTIVFQSFTSYFTYKNGEVKGFQCPNNFLFFSIYNNTIYSHTDQFGFSYLNYKTNRFIPFKNTILKSPVISVLTYSANQALLVTKSDGLFLFDGTNISRFTTECDEELKRAEINRAIITPDGLIVLGTILNGVTAITKQGQHNWTLNTSNVLQNNTILGMFCDENNNLWLALDKGISLLQLNSSLQYIHAFNPSVGSIYSLGYNNYNIYIGTNQGLYKGVLDGDRKNINQLHIEPKVKGQVWSLSQFDNQIICGNNDKTLEVSQGEATELSTINGGICFTKGTIHGKEVLVQGTYTNICVYLKMNGKWQFSHTVEGFMNPIRYVEIDYTGTIWASHLHEGLFAIKLNTDLKKIDQIDTYKALDQRNESPINVFTINNRVVFTNNTAFYTFDDIKKEIVPYDELNSNLGYFAQSYRVCHFKTDWYWFICDGEAALFQVKPNDTKVIDIVQYALFLNQTVDDYQNIIPISDNECIFTLENGLAIYRTNSSQQTGNNPKLNFSKIESSDAESKQFVKLPVESDKSLSTVPYNRNNILFSLYYPHYSSLNNFKFRYKLEGSDKVWSELTNSSSKKFNYLAPGIYTLTAEVLTNSGVKLSDTSYKFEVEPPIYLTFYAKILYLIIILLLLLLAYSYTRKQYYLKKEKLRKEHEEAAAKEIEKREKEIFALKTERLESELSVKSKELAVSTMTIIKKNEILVKIKEEIIAQKDILGSQYPNKYYDKLIRLLDENLSSEEDWAIFQTNFDRIHENFFQNLHQTYPELTSNDLRFCAFLRLNYLVKTFHA